MATPPMPLIRDVPNVAEPLAAKATSCAIFGRRSGTISKPIDARERGGGVAAPQFVRTAIAAARKSSGSGSRQYVASHFIGLLASSQYGLSFDFRRTRMEAAKPAGKAVEVEIDHRRGKERQ